MDAAGLLAALAAGVGGDDLGAGQGKAPLLGWEAAEVDDQAVAPREEPRRPDAHVGALHAGEGGGAFFRRPRRAKEEEEQGKEEGGRELA